MASHEIHPVSVSTLGRGSILMRGGREQSFEVQYHTRFKKQLRVLVTFYDNGWRCIPKWFKDEDEALDAARARWRPVRNGFTYRRTK